MPTSKTATIDGNAHTAAKILQEHFIYSNKKKATDATKMEPTIQKEAQSVTNAPRLLGGAISVTKVKSGGTVAPMPKPAKNRKVENCHTFDATELNSPATELHTRPNIRMGRLPKESPRAPTTSPPTNMPKKTVDAKNPPLHEFSRMNFF
mmetsp:Transcript_4444/g.6898  ORF Transcript_4444/g.6898 Transcript_4444/m.6898 type:complete len:150 (+) Transcript_4444:1367-1816(+)